MLLSMAIEEMVTLIANHDAAGGEISIRLTRFEGGTVLRLRDNGKKFNPVDYYNARLAEADDFEDALDLMGVKYIVTAAEVKNFAAVPDEDIACPTYDRDWVRENLY
jgi:anti-sigma regulatory factor (Ser/Thr protein kinase)